LHVGRSVDWLVGHVSSSTTFPTVGAGFAMLQSAAQQARTSQLELSHATELI